MDSIQRLLAFRFNGQPLLSTTKNRENKPGGGRWANNVYQLQPITGFAIFDDERTSHTPASEEIQAESPMSPQGDTKLSAASVSPSVSGDGDIRKGDTNQIQELTRRLNVNDFKKFPITGIASPVEEDDGRVVNLVEEILETCRGRPLSEILPADCQACPGRSYFRSAI